MRFSGITNAGLVALLAGLIFSGGLYAADAPFPDDPDRVTIAPLDPKAEKASRANALYAQALQHEAAGDRTAALGELRQVVAIEPHLVDAQVHLGNLLIDLKQPDEARSQLQAAAAANPDSNAIRAILGKLEHATNHKETAQSESEAVLAKDPTQTEAMQVLLQIGLDQHALEPALQRVTAQLKAAHAPVESYLALVKLYLDITGKEDPQPDGDTILKALLPIYQQAQTLPKPSVELLSVLADTYHDLDRKEEALKTLRQALAADPDNIEILLRSAGIAGELGQKKEVLRFYEKAYAVNPNQAGVREDLVRAYYENQLPQKAVALMNEGLTHTPDDSLLQMRMGVTLEGLHQEKEARVWFQKALNSPVCPLDAYLKMGAYYVDTHRLQEAGEALALGQKHYPQSAQIRFYQAVQNQGVKNYPAAMECLQDARKLAGNDVASLGVNFYLQSAAIMTTSGHHDQVLPMLREGLQKFPDDPNLLNQQAWEWADEGTHLPEALTVAKHAAELAPDNGSMQDTLGWVYFKMGKAEEALPFLQRAVNMTNNDPSVLQHLGDAYLARGRKTEALAAWRLALTKSPDNSDLNHRIENLAPANHASPRSAPAP